MRGKICIVLALFICSPVKSSPPEDPIKCKYRASNSNCTITNSYGAFPDRSVCRAAEVVFPKTETELISAVARATREKRKMKIATRYSHSIPKLVCPDGEDGILISTKFLDRVININTPAMTMTVESGMTLGQLIDEAAKHSLALPYVPYWSGVTIGGMMSTGAHGSSLWGLGSQVHDYVIQVRIVTPAAQADGYAKLRTIANDNPELDAVKVSLGVLGAISRVTLKLEPLFKRSLSFVKRDDSDLGDEAVTFGRQHEFADFTWYPSQKRVVYRVDDRALSSSSGNGLNDFMGFRPTSSILLSTVRSSEEFQEFFSDALGKCLTGKLTASTSSLTAYGFTNDGILFTGYPIIGDQNRIQSSGSCLYSPEDRKITVCPWDPRVKGLFYHQTTFSIALKKVKAFIEDVQKLVALEPKSLCVLDLYNGILMRYVTSSSAYLGKQEDAVDFDITYYRSKDPRTPRLFEDVLEEIEQIAVFKYDGLPHWGKNRNVAFQGAINKFQKAGEFLKVKQSYDPLELFSSDWTDQILGLKDGLNTYREGCALEGLCICYEDSHCAPTKSYYCRPGKVYQDARVCAFQPT